VIKYFRYSAALPCRSLPPAPARWVCLVGVGKTEERLRYRGRLIKPAIRANLLASAAAETLGCRRWATRVSQTPKLCFGQRAGRNRMTRAACTKSVRPRDSPEPIKAARASTVRVPSGGMVLWH
jgi:hypothetical protein